MDRAQASLPALAVALVVLTGATLVGLTLAEGALLSADRPADERRTAVSLGDRLVAADSPLTDRANVLNRTRLDRFDAGELRSAFPASQGSDVRVTVSDDIVSATEERVQGTTIRRLVVVADSGERTVRPSMGVSNAFTLPRRTDRVEIGLAPPVNETVETVRANDRVVLHDPGGLRGTFDVNLSTRETVRMAFEANNTLPDGSVRVTFPTERTSRATMAVTVDA